jgi:gas vesicle protein
MDRHHKLLYGLGTGVIIGTAAGLLLAPKTGKETRKIVADRAGSIRRQAGETLRQAMKRRNSHLAEASPDYPTEVSG